MTVAPSRQSLSEHLAKLQQAHADAPQGDSPACKGGDAVRAEINRANSQQSTGPRTETGKQRSKFNARRHNLTGHTIIGTEEEMANYFASSERLKADLQPFGEFESRLVQSLADAQWQLDRARSIETNLLFEAASKHTDENDDVRDFETDWATGLSKAFAQHAKQLDLLSRYGSRAHRQVLQIHATLAKIQKERRNQEYADAMDRKRKHNQAFARHQQSAVAGQQTKQTQCDTNNNGFVSQPVSAAATGHAPARQGEELSAKTAGGGDSATQNTTKKQAA